MISYDTIISNFDDKVTLYNWLRKVEEALKNASATNFVVNKKGNATLSFSITFADGTTLESGDIVLQQGESVDQARIASGILQLHLTNGTWLTAGNVKPVSNFEIDASQHLIVNYADGTSQDLGEIFNGNVNINGNFTANSIIENMSGYAWTKSTSSGATDYDLSYVGIVKNGNKITFAIAGSITPTEARVRVDIGYFSIPTAIGNKIFPINESNDIAFNIVGMFSAYNSKVDAYFVPNKSGAGIMSVKTYLSNLSANVKYDFRWEITFLLSNNMAS